MDNPVVSSATNTYAMNDISLSTQNNSNSSDDPVPSSSSTSSSSFFSSSLTTNLTIPSSLQLSASTVPSTNTIPYPLIQTSCTVCYDDIYLPEDTNLVLPYGALGFLSTTSTTTPTNGLEITLSSSSSSSLSSSGSSIPSTTTAMNKVNGLYLSPDCRHTVCYKCALDSFEESSKGFTLKGGIPSTQYLDSYNYVHYPNNLNKEDTMIAPTTFSSPTRSPAKEGSTTTDYSLLPSSSSSSSNTLSSPLPKQSPSSSYQYSSSFPSPPPYDKDESNHSTTTHNVSSTSSSIAMHTLPGFLCCLCIPSDTDRSDYCQKYWSNPSSFRCSPINPSSSSSPSVLPKCFVSFSALSAIIQYSRSSIPITDNNNRQPSPVKESTERLYEQAFILALLNVTSSTSKDSLTADSNHTTVSSDWVCTDMENSSPSQSIALISSSTVPSLSSTLPHLDRILHSSSLATSNHDIVSILCPNNNCNAVLAIEMPNPLDVGTNNNSVIRTPPPLHLRCPSCETSFCNSCGSLWKMDEGGEYSHAGKSCSEYNFLLSSKRLRERAAEILQVFGPGTKMCPYPDCGVPFARFRGHACHHVVCVCGRDLCYVCLQTADEWRAEFGTKDAAKKHFQVCAQLCDDACGCEPCPTCATPNGRSKCTDTFTTTACSGPERCISCALGGRTETETERKNRIQKETTAQLRKKANFPKWPGPRTYRKDLVATDPTGALDAVGVKISAYLNRELHGPASLVREGWRLLSVATSDCPPIPIGNDPYGEQTAAWLTTIDPCSIDQGIQLFTIAMQKAQQIEQQRQLLTTELASKEEITRTGSLTGSNNNSSSNSMDDDCGGLEGTSRGYTPVLSNDVVGGSPLPIVSLSACLEYEHQSLDEWRWEDLRIRSAKNKIATTAGSTANVIPVTVSTSASSSSSSTGTALSTTSSSSVTSDSDSITTPNFRHLSPSLLAPSPISDRGTSDAAHLITLHKLFNPLIPTDIPDGIPSTLAEWRGNFSDSVSSSSSSYAAPLSVTVLNRRITIDGGITRAIPTDLSYGVPRPNVRDIHLRGETVPDRLPTYTISGLLPVFKLLTGCLSPQPVNSKVRSYALRIFEIFKQALQPVMVPASVKSVLGTLPRYSNSRSIQKLTFSPTNTPERQEEEILLLRPVQRAVRRSSILAELLSINGVSTLVQALECAYQKPIETSLILTSEIVKRKDEEQQLGHLVGEVIALMGSDSVSLSACAGYARRIHVWNDIDRKAGTDQRKLEMENEDRSTGRFSISLLKRLVDLRNNFSSNNTILKNAVEGLADVWIGTTFPFRAIIIHIPDPVPILVDILGSKPKDKYLQERQKAPDPMERRREHASLFEKYISTVTNDSASVSTSTLSKSTNSFGGPGSLSTSPFHSLLQRTTAMRNMNDNQSPLLGTINSSSFSNLFTSLEPPSGTVNNGRLFSNPLNPSASQPFSFSLPVRSSEGPLNIFAESSSVPLLNPRLVSSRSQVPEYDEEAELAEAIRRSLEEAEVAENAKKNNGTTASSTLPVSSSSSSSSSSRSNGSASTTTSTGTTTNPLSQQPVPFGKTTNLAPSKFSINTGTSAPKAGNLSWSGSTIPSSSSFSSSLDPNGSLPKLSFGISNTSLSSNTVVTNEEETNESLTDAPVETDVPTMVHLRAWYRFFISGAAGTRSMIYWACVENKFEIVRALIDLGVSIDKSDDDGRTPLMAAARFADATLVRRLLAAGADVHAVEIDAYTSLSFAASEGKVENVIALIEAGANVNHRESRDSQTPLHLACHSSKGIPAIPVLEKYGADLNASDRRGATPLISAIERGKLDIVKALLALNTPENPKIDINKRNLDGLSPLVLATKLGENDIILALLDAGTSVEMSSSSSSSNKKRSIMHFAARYCNGKVVKPLVDKGLSLDALDEYGWNPVMMTTFRDDVPEAVTMIEACAACGSNFNIRGRNGQTAVDVLITEMIGTGGQRLGTLEAFLKAGADPNIPGPEGTKPLSTAIMNGNTDGVRLLLQYGARTDYRDNKKRTVLHLLSDGERIPIPLEQTVALVSSLVPVTDPNASDGSGYSPLITAIQNNVVDVVLALGQVAGTTIINKPCSTGMLPLTAALKANNKEMMELLLSLGADINCMDGNGYTPVFSMVMNNKLDLVKYLVSLGADLTIPSKRTQENVIHVAVSISSVDLLQYLLDQNVPFDTVTVHGNTPLYDAVGIGNISIIQRLITAGANVNFKFPAEHDTVLIHACRYTRVNTIVALLEAGAHVRTRGVNNNSAVITAFEKGNEEIISLLLDKLQKDDNDTRDLSTFTDSKGRTCLHLVVMKGLIKIIPRLIDQNNLTINYMDTDGKTSLHYASEKGLAAVCKLLLEKGANLSLMDKYSRTPIMIAVLRNDIQTVRTLLSTYQKLQPTTKIQSILIPSDNNNHGSSDTDTNSSETVSSTTIVPVLSLASSLTLPPGAPGSSIESEATATTTTGTNVATAFSSASSSSTLLNIGGGGNGVVAPIDRSDETDRTPLMITASKGWYECCLLLLHYQANPLLTTMDHQTAVSIATTEGHSTLAEIITKYGTGEYNQDTDTEPLLASLKALNTATHSSSSTKTEDEGPKIVFGHRHGSSSLRKKHRDSNNNNNNNNNGNEF